MNLRLKVPLTFEFYQEADCWVGKCVEMDIVTSSLSLKRVRCDLKRICKAQARFAKTHGAWNNLFRKPSPQEPPHA